MTNVRSNRIVGVQWIMQLSASSITLNLFVWGMPAISAYALSWQHVQSWGTATCRGSWDIYLIFQGSPHAMCGSTKNLPIRRVLELVVLHWLKRRGQKQELESHPSVGWFIFDSALPLLCHPYSAAWQKITLLEEEEAKYSSKENVDQLARQRGKTPKLKLKIW